MRSILATTFFILSLHATAQQPDTIKIAANNTVQDTTLVDTTGNRARNAYGDLLNDDPQYNPRSHWTVPLLRVTTANVFGWAWLRYVAKASYTKISWQTWKDNLHGRVEWDSDDFGTNFLSHPHAGSDYFNVARSNGYSYWGSLPYALIGSLEWEFFGENTRASKNDLINTPVSGAFLGEIMYRISSNILDDRRRGSSRVSREIFAALIDPTRGLNRFTQGRMWRVTPYDVYQQEPLNVTIQVGAHRVNENEKIGTGSTNAIANIQLDYGDPFEVRPRKPFDVFRVRFESRYGEDKKFVDNIIGYGLLAGKTVKPGKSGRSAVLFGVFQHYDYWSNKVFELGSLGFGPGLISKINFGINSNLYSGLHIAAVPLAGNSTRFGPDTSEFRNYPFGGGWEGRIEERLNLGKLLSIGVNGYYYGFYNYKSSGFKGKSLIGIIKSFITVHLFRGLSVGFEHHVYYDNRYIGDLAPLHLTTTEQKVFLQVFFQDRRRYGRYH